jgi:UDP-arabinose 4-epimerase
MHVLVTGGAGYIGSHTAKQLARAGYEPVVLDDLRCGHRWAVRWGPLVETDLSDREALRDAFRKFRFGAVLHFAALAYVGESMRQPSEYFRNNVVNTLNLLDAMREHSVQRIVFSSSCATYGDPQQILTEDHAQQPVSPYGESKLMVERLLAWYERAYGLSWTCLRYFNAAGADPEGDLGEDHQPETHLIPRAIAAAGGDLAEVEVFGSDYPTQDGTAVRDYIHVSDLATAHVKALARSIGGAPSCAFNLGTGQGYSVREVISVVEQVNRRKVPVKTAVRRAGDPPVLVAESSRANRELCWVPENSTLVRIVETASQWYTSRRGTGESSHLCICDAQINPRFRVVESRR